MALTGDLHCHSTCSDGSCSPAQIVDYACRSGLTHVALTDHDTLSGLPALASAARGLIRAIPGVECSCIDPKRKQPVHLLCYCPKEPERLQQALDATLQNRRAAKLDMLAKLKQLYPLRDSDVLDLCRGCGSVYEVHLMRALANMGYTNTVCGDLMKQLIGKGGSCYTPVVYPDVWEIAALIRDTGGIAVLAHPGQFQSLPLARELCREKLLDGIECFHPRNTPETTRAALELASDYGLLVTGGTDFHGMHARHPHPIGTCVTTEPYLQRLLAMCGI